MLIVILCLFLWALVPNVFCASLDGTSSFKAPTAHYVLRDGDAATGFVRFANGFTILPGASSASSATLTTCLPCSGGFDLQGSSKLILGGNLLLDGATTLTSSGRIYGNNTALVLGGDLTLAANQVLHLDGNLIIDGQGHDVFISEYAQLMLDNGATVTIKNATIHNKRNVSCWPSIAITTTTTRLTLSDVELALDSDLYVNSGQVFVHNDVAVTGTSALVWRSCGPCTIEQNSCLYFDHGTTFSFAPATDNKDLVRMSDASSVLALNGCTLKATHTGLRMVKGCVLFGDKVTVNSTHENTINTSTPIKTPSYDAAAGGSYSYRACAWSPDGKYVSVAYASGDSLQIFSIAGGTPIKVGSGIATGSYPQSCSWSPDGKYIAVVSWSGFSTLRVFTLVGEVLVQVGSNVSTPASARCCSWSPDGKYIAVGNEYSGDQRLAVYAFSGKTPTLVGSSEPGGWALSSCVWSPDGKYIVVTLASGSLRVYAFSGATPTQLGADVSLGESPQPCVWSPDGRYLATVSYGNNILRVFSFSSGILTQVGSDAITGTNPYSCSWSPDGKYIAVVNYTSPKLQVFAFAGGTPYKVGGDISLGDAPYRCAWSPDGRYIAVIPVVTTTIPLRIYAVNYQPDRSEQVTSRSIVFGNSAAGSSADATVKLLSGAQVNVSGIVNIDNVTATPDFADRDARFVLQDSSSKIKFTPTTVPGWKENSIIKSVSGSGEGDYNLGLYAGSDDIITQALAPYSLAYGTSADVVELLSRSIDMPLRVLYRSGASIMLYNDHELYSGNTSVSDSPDISFFKKGFTVADGVALTLNITQPVAGNISLGGSGKLILSGDLTLASNAYLTSGGVIDGGGKTLLLTSSLVVPVGKRLKITGNILIDGGGHDFVLGQGAQLIIDPNISVTLRNLNWRNSNSEPHLEMRASTSRLTLDNVATQFDRDFTYSQGRLFIYNDVAITGTKQFSYAAAEPMYIKSLSCLHFDQGTTFSYAPMHQRAHDAAHRSLIRLVDDSSIISFDNCMVNLPDYGLQLSTGRLLFDNKVTINGNTSSSDVAHSFELGNGTSDLTVNVLSGANVVMNGYLYHHPA